VYTSDSLKPILSHLSTKVMNIIANGTHIEDLHYLLEFLAAWEKRPLSLTPMAHQWCSTLSKVAGSWGEPTGMRGLLQPLRLKLQDPTCGVPYNIEEAFSKVGRYWEFLHSGNTFHRACRHLQNLSGPTLPPYVDLLHAILEIGFRLVTPDVNPDINHTLHHTRVFEIAFSSSHDEVVADTVSMWITGYNCSYPGSSIYYLAKRMERGTPFPPRLRRVCIHAIERIWNSPDFEASGLEIFHLLNRLNVGVDDIGESDRWVSLLVDVTCLPAGLESLSSHYWHLLDRLVLDENIVFRPQYLEVMRLLEKSEDWEKLEVWMMVIWISLAYSEDPFTMDEVKQVTLKLLSQRALALLRFEDLRVRESVDSSQKAELQWICDGVRAKQWPSESTTLLYVSILPALCIPLLMPPLSLPQSADSRPVGRSTSFYGRRHLLKWFIVSIVSQCAKLGCVFCFLEYTEGQSMILRKVTSEFKTNLPHDTLPDFVVSVGTKESHEEDRFRRISLC
jgi:hypothetical protein